ncbi:hypothetical protein Pmar_PMAR003661 [Perkinsus marinus ATCC 50983]|uniref:Uncharacterized protein n=1 Tax=Perkinsus marinus (strain ATCC 50983 / TXsc) TaxID=423536 RepID=C5KHY6_PERM5|nr:hypothetical protein Pmar_PMAR003661 [Perkinsus marinus ATCC 50983]EER16198.1 hypothetical protein Pmar_PMAR003661 [Perkinsus marinus ATCC 50983]|eukprot:XP_002784402.1 hypothetical protein Pmar_PMAR003661 [Perkinsus marinus ATCC 50983]
MFRILIATALLATAAFSSILDSITLEPPVTWPGLANGTKPAELADGLTATLPPPELTPTLRKFTFPSIEPPQPTPTLRKFTFPSIEPPHTSQAPTPTGGPGLRAGGCSDG